MAASASQPEKELNMNDIFVGVKEWHCKNGHLLGLVKRVKIELPDGMALHVSRLLLFRQAVDREAVNLEEIDVIAAVEGTALEIRCSVCGEVRPWYIGADAMERLLEKIAPAPASATRVAETADGGLTPPRLAPSQIKNL
jgi:hypothetical protein